MVREREVGSHFVLTATERMAHSVVNYWLVLVVDVMGAAVFLVAGIRRFSGSLFFAGASVIVGFLAWGLLEYVLHRFVMHGRPSMARRGHALHHADGTAFISTPAFIVMAAAWVICAMLSLVFPVGVACLLVFGLYAGYNYYALLHHVQHHRATGLAGVGYFARLARTHRIHHDDHLVNYGVSTTIWDRLLGTFRPENESGNDQRPRRRLVRPRSTFASLRRLHP
jgi:sterol desaturase/sphingolipid hydroxylase (fatty acid hydroxylase superfamily)